MTVYLHSSAHDSKPTSVTTSRSGYKVTKIMAMILGAYLLSIIPQAVVFTITQRLKYQPLHIQIMEKISIWIFMVNSWINAVIYGYKSNDFKQAYRKLLKLKAENTLGWQTQ